MRTEPLTQEEALVIRLIADGRTRQKIAELAGLYEDDVRGIIIDLCARFECRTRDLPTVAAGQYERQPT